MNILGDRKICVRGSPEVKRPSCLLGYWFAGPSDVLRLYKVMGMAMTHRSGDTKCVPAVVPALEMSRFN